MDLNNIEIETPEIPTAEQGGGVSGIVSEDSIATKDVLFAIGSFALGLFIIGNIVFNLSNYKILQQIKKKEQV